jgi:type I restriction enzyme S subunit
MRSDAVVVRRLAEVAEIALSGVDKHTLPGEQPVRLCNYTDVYYNRRITNRLSFMAATARPREVERFALRKGDILITKDSEVPDDIGVPALVAEEVPDTLCGYHLALIRPREGLNPLYLLYVLDSEIAKRHFLATATGVTRFGLGLRDIATTPIPVFAPDLQAGVARVLDSVDTMIQRTRAAVERAEEFRRSLIETLVHEGTDRQSTRKTDAGLLPGSWRCEPLGARIAEGPTNGLYRPESDYGVRGTPIVRIDSFYDGTISGIDSLRRVVIDSVTATRFRLAPRDLLINRVNSMVFIGKAAIVPELAEPTVFESNMMRFQCGNALLPEFLIIVLCSDVARRHWLARAKPAVNQASINQRDVVSLPIPVPPLPEQKRIAAIVGAAFAKIEAIREVERRHRALKQALTHDLLTDRVGIPALMNPIGKS